MSDQTLEDVLAPQHDPEPASDPEVAEQPAEQPEAEQTKGQEPAPEPEAEAKPAEAEPEPEKSEPEKADHTVPLKVLMAERDQRRELEARLKALEAERQKPPEKNPDVFEDPEGYTKHMQAQIRQATDTVRLDVSEQAARSQFGDDAVNAAFSALVPDGKLADAAAYQAIMAERSPYHALVKWHQKTEAMREIGDDPKAWKDSVRESLRREIEAELVTKQVRQVPAPPPSLSSETNVSSGPAAPPSTYSLDEIFGKGG